MKYLKKFENHQAYQAAESGLILPNVSLCVQENEVHYNPYVDPYGGHEYVEIGGLKWATMNVGANSITDYGLYYQWGDTQGYTAAQCGSGEGQKYFGWEDYKYAANVQGYDADMTKYNSTDEKTILEPSDDAATAAWGGNWRMPTKEEFAALSAAVTTQWVNDYQGSGVYGRLMTDKTDNSKVLFFPACDNCYSGKGANYINSFGYYWMASLYTEYANYFKDAYRIYFGNASVTWRESVSRYFGHPIRPVAD